MATSLITKFAVASERNTTILVHLAQRIAREKFSNLLAADLLERYVLENCSPTRLMAEMNSLSDQWLIVYANDDPVGYARVTPKGARPDALQNRRAIRIADFGVLADAHPGPDIALCLYEKCSAVCRSYESVWIKEYVQNPLIPFFEAFGFTRQPQPQPCRHDELPLDVVCLIYAQK